MDKKFYKTDYNKMLFGVCNGLAEYFSIDVSLVRIIFVLATFLGFGMTIVLYIALAIILPTKMY
ncbi:PspC domain-containing protein [Erysipelotrichaceae bacterium OttesenSCG-928-M19]|nr:PspC domain-containing protein [Erysipelotrichaceae bacterium OttesenSCG-928-M19]